MADISSLSPEQLEVLRTSSERVASELSAVATALSPSDCLARGGELNGKVVVITGAASGFGRAYALKAASFGAKVVASDLSTDTLETLVHDIAAAGGSATSIKCDTTIWEDQVAMFDHAVKTYGVVDVVLPNAGIPESGEWLSERLTPEGKLAKPDLKTLDVNITGAVYTVKLAFYHLNRNPSRGLKSIVILGSMSSFFGIPAGSMYTLTKHAVLGLFRSAYHQGKVDGISFSIVCPWFVLTPILHTPARLLIAGLPLAEVPVVVEAMIYGSTAVESGNTLCVDASGVLAIPFTALGAGSEGYYHVFVQRASGALSTIRYIKDVLAALKRAGMFRWVEPLLVIVALVAYRVFK